MSDRDGCLSSLEIRPLQNSQNSEAAPARLQCHLLALSRCLSIDSRAATRPSHRIIPAFRPFIGVEAHLGCWTIDVMSPVETAFERCAGFILHVSRPCYHILQYGNLFTIDVRIPHRVSFSNAQIWALVRVGNIVTARAAINPERRIVEISFCRRVVLVAWCLAWLSVLEEGLGDVGSCWNEKRRKN